MTEENMDAAVHRDRGGAVVARRLARQEPRGRAFPGRAWERGPSVRAVWHFRFRRGRRNLLPREFAVGDADAERQRPASTEEAQLDLFVDGREADEVDQVVVVLDARAVEFAGSRRPWRSWQFPPASCW